MSSFNQDFLEALLQMDFKCVWERERGGVVRFPVKGGNECLTAWVGCYERAAYSNSHPLFSLLHQILWHMRDNTFLPRYLAIRQHLQRNGFMPFTGNLGFIWWFCNQDATWYLCYAFVSWTWTNIRKIFI